MGVNLTVAAVLCVLPSLLLLLPLGGSVVKSVAIGSGLEVGTNEPS